MLRLIILLSPLFLIPALCSAQNFGGNLSSIKWMQVNTPSSRVIFPKGLDSQANRVNNVIKLLDSVTLYSIGDKKRKWNVVLQNQTTNSNAYVRLAPVISELQLTPGQNNFSNGSLRADDNLIIHEDRHMQQFSNFNHGFTKVFSFLFGQEGQLLANGITIPDYFFEGDAVFQETLVSAQGRGRMPYFFNGFKSLWLQNKNYSWMKLRSGSLRHYTPDHYQLGYPLVAYGYDKYGEDFWRKVTGDAVEFKGLFYSFSNAIEKYSGKTYTQFRLDALQYFKAQTLSPDQQDDRFNFITPVRKNNVVDYLFPAFVNDDTIIVTKQSYKQVNSFYFLISGKEKKIRMKDYVTDDYFSYKNGKVVYAAFQSDPRWDNRDYSVIQLLDIYSKQQQQLTFKSKYFSPDINDDGTEVIAVNVKTDGSNFLHRLNAATGELISEVPNANNYFFTQTKYIDNNNVVSATRNAKGQMALVKVNLTNGSTELLTEFSYNVLGYPQVVGNLVYFGMTDHYTANNKTADRIFAVNLSSKELHRITNNKNGVYQPAINSKGDLIFSAFTSDGLRLVKTVAADINKNDVVHNDSSAITNVPANRSLQTRGAGVLHQLAETKNEAAKYRKSFGLLNFHSARPFVDDPELGYTFYSDNILSSFHSEVKYTYNRNEQSHAVGFDVVYAGMFPFLRAGVERSFNRKVDTGSSIVQTFNYNSTKLYTGFSIPLSFINGRTFKYLNFGGTYNSEKIYVPYQISGKETDVKALNYVNAFFSFNNQSRKPKQFINPAWAQTFSFTYRDAFNIIDNHKLVADASLYFPGLFTNHSLVIDGAFQKRDSLGPDFFSKTFSNSRGYQDLNQRRMYKLGVNYHFPLCYPDWGFGNIIFFQRIRVNAFFDYGSSLTKFRDGTIAEIKSRSTGAELNFDTKVWNALPVSFGIRYSRLLDRDLLNQGAVNRWEIILPINIIPN
jgi:hypothetical protein